MNELFFYIEMPDNIVSDTRHTIHGYKLRCVKELKKSPRKHKIVEHWFCLNEGSGAGLPRYIREGSKFTGFKSYNSFFSMLGYYNSK